MIAHFIIAATALAGWTVASPALANSKATIYLPTVTLDERGFVGDASSCSLTGGLEVVKVHEIAHITATDSLSIGTLVSQDLLTKATVESNINVCACVDAKLPATAVPASLVRGAKTELTAFVNAHLGTSADIRALHTLLGKADLKLDLDLAAIAVS
ncbi:hypothetical protein EMMF5_004387 [Cystobasidiomycetes sp. EMM_F5]